MFGPTDVGDGSESSWEGSLSQTPHARVGETGWNPSTLQGDPSSPRPCGRDDRLQHVGPERSQAAHARVGETHVVSGGLLSVTSTPCPRGRDGGSEGQSTAARKHPTPAWARHWRFIHQWPIQPTSSRHSMVVGCGIHTSTTGGIPPRAVLSAQPSGLDRMGSRNVKVLSWRRPPRACRRV